MEDRGVPRAVYRFGGFALDLRRAALLGPDGAEIVLRPKSFDVLRHLVENAGRIASRHELLEAVWPGVHINDDGITQCVREVRRALGDEAQRLVRTVPKRGYLLAAQVASPSAETPEAVAAVPDTSADTPHPVPLLAAAEAAHAALPDLSVEQAPRLSLVVLPFANRSGDAGQDYLANAVTDDLTTDLTKILGAFVIGRGSAQTYRGRAVDARQVGSELGVRHIVQGSVRRLGEGVVRVNAELVSAETGKQVWAERFDQEIVDFGRGQNDIVRRLGIALDVQLIRAESARAVRERPNDLTAFDLVLRAWAVLTHAPSRANVSAAQALFERALERDSESLPAAVGLANTLILERLLLREGRPDNVCRAEELLAAAERLDSRFLSVIHLRGDVRRAQERYDEAATAYREVIEADPNAVGAYHLLGICETGLGRPEAAVPFFNEAIRRDPRSPGIWTRYNGLGHALLHLRCPVEAATWLRRALDAHPDRDEVSALGPRIGLTSALAHIGQARSASRELRAVMRLEPFFTARGFEPRSERLSLEVEQRLYVADGLRLAGMRDHVIEDNDPGVPETSGLHSEPRGPTPMTVPGAATVLTDEVRRLIAELQPITLDLNDTGRSLPGAVVLGHSMAGGNLDDGLQDRLRRLMHSFADGSMARPIITVGWNAERWGARNLALRLVALGYTHVYWYRGGKEVWEARGLPETDADLQDW